MGALGRPYRLGWANPNECLSQVRGGLVRILGVALPERIKIFPDVPTFKEMGYDEVYRQFRAISGAPGMPDYAVKTIAEALKRSQRPKTGRKGTSKRTALPRSTLGLKSMQSSLRM